MRIAQKIFLLLVAAVICPIPARAQPVPVPVPVPVPLNIPLPLADLVPASPKQPWFDLATAQIQPDSPWWSEVLLYVPNRVLDLIDIFRIDVGVGPSVGAVVRVTEYGQVGFREMVPGSLRVGDLGRRFPVMIETSNEFGIGPAYVESSQRKVCPGEVGVGGDVLVAGAYGGVCLDEVVDFLAGLVLIDLKDDDFR